MDNIELKLPQSGAVVVMKSFISVGQSRDLQKVLLSSGQFDAETQKFSNINPETFLDMQDKAAEFLILEVKVGEEKHPFTKEWLYNLPQDDGNLVYNKINDLINASNLSEESKKK